MSKGFVAYVYENDKIEIQKLVQQYPDIETGGDLFGLWKDEKTVIIQQFIGPGKKCSRTTTSFHQDIEYLAKVGSLITTEEGLCNVGEWHSHHQIGMPKPSGADRTTVFSNMPHLGLERFVLFIASIKSTGGEKRSHDVQLKDIELRPFLFLGSTQDVVEGDIKIIRSENPHRRNIRKEIKDGAEVPKSTSTSTSHESEKKRRGGKGRGTPAQDETEKKNDTPTLQQQALASQTVPPYPDRSAKPERTTETEPYIDDASLGRKTQEDQQRARPEKDQYTERKHEEKGDQTQRRDNNENRSPNTGSAPPRDVGSQSPPTSPLTSQINTPQHSGTTQAWGPGAQRNAPPTTSAPTSFKQVYDDSLHYGTAQERDRGNPGNGPMLTNPPTSQHFSPHSGAAQHVSTGQGGHQGTQWQGNFPQQTYPPSSQKHTTQHPQTRGCETQRNIPPTGGAHSSSQNPQHPRYAQIESQRSARDRDRCKRNMQSNQSYSPSSQAQAKGNSGTIAVTNLSAGGYF